eukprot:scaffold305_cov267-Chaetoceros_neogracile.AAC.24
MISRSLRTLPSFSLTAVDGPIRCIRRSRVTAPTEWPKVRQTISTSSLFITDHGLWIMDHGSWIMDHGSWIMDHGSWN